ncbi:MAG: prephenate dehydrogenase [Endomicrobiia bacterium]|nr:prephenate dehydrogenase [Endomicrobiia bacterium]
MNIAVIGTGLIGGSVGMALRGKKISGRKIRIVGVGRSPERLNLALRLGAIDEWTLDIKAGAAGADAVLVCLPVDMIAPTVIRILPHLKPGAVITDVGSVKKNIVEQIEKLSGNLGKRPGGGACYVGSHPIAGAEKTSVRHARGDLFRGAVVVVTPDGSSDDEAVKLVKKIWKTTGARVFEMSAAEHDAKLAATSHLPHAIAYALVNSVGARDFRFAGSGFKDTTRIASSNPAMWAEIILANKKEILKSAAAFSREISKIMRAKTTKALARILSSAKKKRAALGRSSP